MDDREASPPGDGRAAPIAAAPASPAPAAAAPVIPAPATSTRGENVIDGKAVEKIIVAAIDSVPGTVAAGGIDNLTRRIRRQPQALRLCKPDHQPVCLLALKRIVGARHDSGVGERPLEQCRSGFERTGNGDNGITGHRCRQQCLDRRHRFVAGQREADMPLVAEQ